MIICIISMLYRQKKNRSESKITRIIMKVMKKIIMKEELTDFDLGPLNPGITMNLFISPHMQSSSPSSGVIMKDESAHILWFYAMALANDDMEREGE